MACLVYVIFNAEVRQALKSRWNRWNNESEFMDRVRPYCSIPCINLTTDSTTTVEQSTDLELLPSQLNKHDIYSKDLKR